MTERCHNCERAIYRHGDVWKHYFSDAEWCYPSLSYLDAFSSVAEP